MSFYSLNAKSLLLPVKSEWQKLILPTPICKQKLSRHLEIVANYHKKDKVTFKLQTFLQYLFNMICLLDSRWNIFCISFFGCKEMLITCVSLPTFPRPLSRWPWLCLCVWNRIELDRLYFEFLIERHSAVCRCLPWHCDHNSLIASNFLFNIYTKLWVNTCASIRRYR